MKTQYALIGCIYDCGKTLEQSKMITHIHDCPNRPKDSLMEFVMSKDANEDYIEEPQWPDNLPLTRDVVEIMKKLGLKPPFDISADEDWMVVESKAKKFKNDWKKHSGRGK